MGMYTGIRCKIIINEEFAPVINTMMTEGLDWNDLSVEYPQYDFLNEFGDGYRASFIPYGVLSYMPDEWDTDDFERRFDPQTRLWSFRCSLKNYESDIERFFKVVLPKITERVVHLEYYYEEWTRSVFYELVNGEIIRSEREGILYGLEDEPDNWGI